MRKDKSWKSQKKAAIHVPLVNLITNTDSLLAAAHVATEFMSALRPASIRNAIAAQIAKIEAVDGRFTVRVDVADNKEQIWITPKPGESITIKLQFKGDREHLDPKLDNLFGKGLPTVFEPGELELLDLPFLVGDLRQGATLSVIRSTSASVRVYALANSNRILSHIEIPGSLTGGNSEIRFQSLPSDSILNFKTTFAFPQGVQNRPAFNLHFNAKLWDNVPILNLPQFDILDQFFSGMAKAKSLKSVYYSEGNIVYTGTISFDRIAKLKRLPDIFAYVSAFRSVCRQCKINPPLSDRIDDPMEFSIFVMDLLLKKGRLKYRMPGGTVTMHLPRESVMDHVKVFMQSVIVLTDTSKPSATILGQEVDLGIITIEITDLMLTSTVAEIQILLHENADSTVPVKFSGGKKSIYSILRPKPKINR